MTMNIIAAKRQLESAGKRARAIIDTKGLTNATKAAQLNALEAEVAEAKSAIETHSRAGSLMSGGDMAPAGVDVARAERGLAVKGLATPPTRLSAEDTDKAFRTLKGGGSFRVELKDATNSEAVRGNLPPQLAGLVTAIHEPSRILDHIPTMTTPSPAVELITHTANTPGIGAPVLALGTAASGGTFAAGSYFWKVTALSSGGETNGSNEVTATLTANQKQPLSWAAITGADGYRIYRGIAAGAENVLVAEVAGGATVTYTDLGSAGTNATPPAVDRTPGAKIVAAGGLMPEFSLVTSKTILQAQKIALFTRQTDELIQDYATFTSYTEVELQRLITDAENWQVLHGNGTGEILGLLNTAGTLTRAKSASDTSSLDTLEQGITDLRNGPSFTEPDLLVIHPQTWSAIRRTKDSYGRYLLGDPGQTTVSDVWGVPVLQTTQITPGLAVLANLSIAAQGWIREGFTLSMSNTDQDNFERGLVSIRAEERLMVGVARPTAINIITGL